MLDVEEIMKASIGKKQKAEVEFKIVKTMTAINFVLLVIILVVIL